MVILVQYWFIVRMWSGLEETDHGLDDQGRDAKQRLLKDALRRSLKIVCPNNMYRYRRDMFPSLAS
jgi:hypothetical protein